MIFCLLLAASALAQTPAADPDQTAFTAVCGSCHSTTIASDPRTEEEWKDTVTQMIAIGAKGTPGQFEAVTRFLAANLTIVNVNTATVAQLAAALGITAKIAQAVVDYRTGHGPFKHPEDLAKVQGLDPSGPASRRNRIVF